jgi:hypothetical protein
MSTANGDVPESQLLPSSITTQAIWDQRVLGFSVHEIGQQTGLSVEKVGELLVSHHRQRRSTRAEGIDFYRDLALARAEALIRVYLQTALRDSRTVERLRAGEPVVEEDVDHPLRCACLVLSLLRFQTELLGLRAGEVFKTDKAGSEGVLSWLRNQTEFIKQVVREAPSDVATLPTEQLDSARSQATELKTLGSQVDRHKLSSEDLELDFDPDQVEIPVAVASTTETLGRGPSDPVEDPLEAERRERFFRGECDAL